VLPWRRNNFPYRNGRSVSGANAASEAAFLGQNAASSRLKRGCIFIEAALLEMFPQKLCRFCVVTRRISILFFEFKCLYQLSEGRQMLITLYRYTTLKKRHKKGASNSTSINFQPLKGHNSAIFGPKMAEFQAIAPKNFGSYGLKRYFIRVSDQAISLPHKNSISKILTNYPIS
jgi:hypothetical protein